jgi:hypothetical protein
VIGGDGNGQGPDLADVPVPLRAFQDIPTAELTAYFWQGWSADTSAAEAARGFAQRYGAWPRTITRGRNVVLAGPLPEKAVRG